MMSAVILPELGEGITKATVACWHTKPGDNVREGDDLVELVTDKATFNVSAEKSGVLKEILVPEGKEAPVGATLAVIE
jgi:pyruvate/2-oxoglutarate dehydrogenase complex dihydrolipoamide acyltransferase (E2) component